MERRFAVSFSGGRDYGTSSGALEDAMVAAGLDETSPAGCSIIGFCWDAQAHPYSTDDLYSSMTISVFYAVKPRLRVGVLWGTARLGRTSGYRSGNRLTLTQDATTVAALAAFPLTAAVRVGAGPSLNFVRASEDDAPQPSTTVPGFVLDAALTVPARSRVFLELSAQYRYVAPADVGPFKTADYEGAYEMARTSIPFSYAVVSMGLGLRL